ncbi:CREB-regulated transcription coactivator 1 isoform X4 [Nasonia vitripennis]|uniref:CREB-regulated transcription coactivator 1 n=1 Tax=Nasonia vitripennis TaxID=7425 RepID=A0A7M7PZ97_NASVI|nr:CREB-regulated transcription coactivator 1 isoform X4 [Nasonia vitripennis]
MANPRKFSEKIALINQKEAEETARFEAIMKEVSDVTSKVASANASPTSTAAASTSSSAGTSRQATASAAVPAGPEAAPTRPLSVKSAGASPPQSSGKLLHINLGQQYRAGSLPNVNANNAVGAGQSNVPELTGKDILLIGQIATSATLHSIDLKTALNNLEEMQQSQLCYRQGQAPAGNVQQPGGGGGTERGRSMGVGPMRHEKRHDTSPYSGVPYLSPPLPETHWRRTNSDSALHQSANEACHHQSHGSPMTHRRGSDAYQQRGAHGGSSNDNRGDSHHHHGFIERPRSSCDMPRVPGINVYPSSQPPGQQIPIGNNTGSLPDLSNVRFSSPLVTPLDQEDHSSGSQYSNSPQTSHQSPQTSPTTLSPTSLVQAASAQQGLTQENNTSASQQDLRVAGYSPQQQNVTGTTSPGIPQQHPVAHSPGHYVYQQPHSPVAPQSPNASQAQVHPQNTQGPFNSLNYRTTQMVNRPSPQSSPSITYQESPLSYSNNASAPSSPTGHHGPPNLSLDSQDQNVFINQVHADFEQFSMAPIDWAQMMQQLEDTGYTLSTPLDEMDSPSTTIGPYMNSPSHSGTYAQNDILSVTSELGSGDGGYFSTSPLQPLGYHARTPTTTQQLTPQTPNTPTITLTDCSLGPDDFGPSIAASFGTDIFATDDALGCQELSAMRQEDINALRQGLGPLDLDELQRLANSDMVISDPTTEADFRLEQR